ncbi:MAG: ribulose-phosphate 3-epimerase [Bacilli bacterium]
MSSVQIAPSILSADLGHLAEACEVVSKSADILHLDVMDGRFAPNFTIGPDIVAAVRQSTSLPLDVHLMVEEPEQFLSLFRDAGADRIAVHWEACANPEHTISQIRKLGVLAGIALKVDTAVDVLKDLLNAVDYVVILSVDLEPGKKNFRPLAIEKVRRLASLRGDQSRPLIEVDGGINRETAALFKAAGGDILVAGTAVFRADDPVAAIQMLREA